LENCNRLAESRRDNKTLFARKLRRFIRFTFEVGDFKEISFDAQGKPHRIVFEGEGNYDMQKTAADMKKDRRGIV
jgi:predicted metalloprotease with PDZ domain